MTGGTVESWLRLYPDEPKERSAYLGVTNDLATRIEQHRSGAVPGFTKKYQCHRLVWFEQFENIHDAREVERRMKAWKREWKIKRIEELNPQWDDLVLQL